jgi:hypothetical protein
MISRNSVFAWRDISVTHYGVNGGLTGTTLDALTGIELIILMMNRLE